MLPIPIVFLVLVFVDFWVIPWLYHFVWYVLFGLPVDIPPTVITALGGVEKLTSPEFAAFQDPSTGLNYRSLRTLIEIVQIDRMLREETGATA